MALLASACSPNLERSLKRPASDFTFRYSAGGCFGSCPIFKAEFTNNGRLHYQGQRFTSYLGDTSLYIAEEEIDTLRQLLATNYPKLDTVYDEQQISDLPVFLFSLETDRGLQKKVFARHEWPSSLQAIKSYCDKLLNRRELVRIKKGQTQ
jgi:hypothetical protein